MSDSDTPLPALYRAVQAELKAAWPERTDFDLGDWILAQRKNGKSFPEIGYAIRDAIGQYVSHETLRRWARETEARPEEVPAVEDK
jgi:hypothetical protein